MPFHGQRRHVIGPRKQFPEGPARRFCGVVVHAQERGGMPRGERYVEAIKGKREAVAPRLEVGLLPSPAGKEGFEPAWGRQPAERGDFPPGEEALGNILGSEVGSDALDVDADLPATGNGVQGNVAGMGDIEANIR